MRSWKTIKDHLFKYKVFIRIVQGFLDDVEARNKFEIDRSFKLIYAVVKGRAESKRTANLVYT